MKETNCKNCGAPIDLKARKCAYCGTPYVVDTSLERDLLAAKTEALRLTINTEALYSEAMRAYATPNEIRATHGLRPFN